MTPGDLQILMVAGAEEAEVTQLPAPPLPSSS